MAEELPWFPLHVDALEDSATAREADCEAFGAYMRLLIHEWKEGGIPADHRRLQRILKLSPRQFADVWDVIGRKFEPVDGDPSRLVNPRLEQERAEAHARSEQRSAASKASWDHRRKRDQSGSNAAAQREHSGSTAPAKPALNTVDIVQSTEELKTHTARARAIPVAGSTPRGRVTAVILAQSGAVQAPPVAVEWILRLGTALAEAGKGDAGDLAVRCAEGYAAFQGTCSAGQVPGWNVQALEKHTTEIQRRALGVRQANGSPQKAQPKDPRKGVLPLPEGF